MAATDTSTDPPSKKLRSTFSSPLQPPTAVLDDEYYVTEVELVDVYVGKVKHKNQIGLTLQQLKTALPMCGILAHLKRVRRDEIILAPVDHLSKKDCVRLVASKLPHLQPMVCTCQVPAVAPKTKAQHRDANAYWPCNFHPAKVIEQLLADQFFSHDQIAIQHQHMRLAVDTAQRNRSPSAAVVVNPRTNSVVAVAFDQRHQNPSHHAAMLCLEKVAEMQRIPFKDGKCGRTAAETMDYAGQQSSDELCGEIGGGDDDGGGIDDELPYLCTGYDVFVTREPCMMCAMAMVHSRVRRVFYGCCAEHGALGTKCKLHRQRQLNHRYLAFKNLMAEDCRQLEAFEIR